MVAPVSSGFISMRRGAATTQLFFLYLLKTSTAIVAPPERPTAWARTGARGMAGAAFQKDRTDMKNEGLSGHPDPGNAFVRPAFARSNGGTTQSKGPAAYGTLIAPPQVCIRTARREDIPQIEACNLKALPENYPNAFYHNHLLQWPYLALVAERKPMDTEGKEKGDAEKKIVGYVLGRVETHVNNNANPYERSMSMEMYSRVSRMTARKTGHVSSLAVLDEYRRHGIGRELMDILHVQMRYRYGVDSSTLHVRCSNRGAQKLYVDSLGYKILETVEKYYQDGADAYYMKLDFNEVSEPVGIPASALEAGQSSIREKENALLTQDSHGYFTLYRNTNAASTAGAGRREAR